MSLGHFNNIPGRAAAAVHSHGGPKGFFMVAFVFLIMEKGAVDAAFIEEGALGHLGVDFVMKEQDSFEGNISKNVLGVLMRYVWS